MRKALNSNRTYNPNLKYKLDLIKNGMFQYELIFPYQPKNKKQSNVTSNSVRNQIVTKPIPFIL